MTSVVEVLHICQVGASGLVHDGSSFAPILEPMVATWFAWGRRPHTIRMVAHGNLPQVYRRAYEAAIRLELDRLGGVCAEPIE